MLLSRDEVVRILKATDNLKHHALLALVYFSGLRVSEAVRLRADHIETLLVVFQGLKWLKLLDFIVISMALALEKNRLGIKKYSPRNDEIRERSCLRHVDTGKSSIPCYKRHITGNVKLYVIDSTKQQVLYSNPQHH